MKADVVVVGGGVAGLAAAHALAARGARVTLLERKPYFGGRAYSYPHPALGTVVDSQHVLLGCCTNLIDLLQRTGTAETVRWYDDLVFLEPGGRVNRIAPGWMPAPLHSSLSFLSAPMLGVEDKLGIARALMDLMHPRPLDDNESMAGWLQRTGQTKKSIRRFWDLTVSVTLNDSLENCSLRYGAKVFRELLLKSVAGGRLGIPMLPLSDLYGRVAESIVMLGGEVALRADVDGLLAEKNGRWRVHSEAGEWSADAVVLAGSFDQVQQMLRMLPESAERAALDARLQRFVHSSIITTHLWFDREFTDLHSAAMLDTMYQWIFHKSRIRGADPTRGSYVELVIGAANGLLKLDRSELIQAALDELQIFFPELAKCKLVKSGVLKEARATFSATPGLDAFRPGAATAWPGLYLAGDWTRTEWPSTMESAARGGYLAAEAVCSAANESATILVPDVEASGLMKMFG